MEAEMLRGFAFGCLLIAACAVIAAAGIHTFAGMRLNQTVNAEPTTPKIQDRLTAEERPARSKGRRAANLPPPSPAGKKQASDGGLWTWSGSALRLDMIGRARRFTFVGLRRGLLAKDGDPAFDGVREGPTLSGLAFLYTENCAPIPYPVRGAVSPDESTVVLRGKKPRRDAACAVTGASDEELIFTLASGFDTKVLSASAAPNNVKSELQQSLPDDAPR
jgi:hypothetical protein